MLLPQQREARQEASPRKELNHTVYTESRQERPGSEEEALPAALIRAGREN